MQARLNDDYFMTEDAYQVPTCIYKNADENKINPFKFIDDGQNGDCQKAVLRFLNRVDMTQIKELINSIPEVHGALGIMPDIQKEFNLRLLEMRLEKLREVVE